MSDGYSNGYANAEVIRVEVTNLPEPARKDRNTTYGRIVLGTNATVQALGHAPKRRRALLTFTGQAGDVVYVCGSLADAQANPPTGAPVPANLTVPLELTGSDDVWVTTTSANSPTLGVIAEYDPS